MINDLAIEECPQSPNPMTTLVMVEKDGVACMAADTLMSSGPRKHPARYVAHPEKILRVGGAFVGFVGRYAHQNVLESAFSNGSKLPEIAHERDLFEFSRILHRKLKKDYFLNPSEDFDDPYESSQMMLYILNRHGMFALYSLRSVERCRRFAATGSGSSYALGAMYAAYERDLCAEEIAPVGVEAGIEFDSGSLGPITIERIECRRIEAVEPEAELVT